MGKIKLFSVVFALSSVCIGQEVDKNKFKQLNYKTATAEEYRAVFNELISSTEGQYIRELSTHTQFHLMQHRADLTALRTEFDAELAKKPNLSAYLCGISWCNALWPLTMEAIGEYTKATENFPTIVTIAKKYNLHGLWTSALSLQNVSLDDAIRLLNEASTVTAISPPLYMSDIKGIKQYIQKTAVKVIKRKLREQGKSFVTKDGVNPCEEYLTRLNAALDAPRFAGLNAWLEGLGFEARIDETKFPTPAALQELKDKVFYGEVDANNKNKKILYIGLGVAEYNKFVKEYNGEK